MRAASTAFVLALTLATSAWAQSATAVSILNGGEVAPNQVLTGAVGVAALTIDLTKGEATFDIAVFNLPSGIRGAHLHLGSPGMVGPVLFDLRPTPSQSGDFTLRGTLSGADLTPRADLGIRDAVDALQSAIGLATYIDIHTDGKQDGEIRGALVIVPTTDSPEAAAYRTLRRSQSLERR